MRYPTAVPQPDRALAGDRLPWLCTRRVSTVPLGLLDQLAALWRDDDRRTLKPFTRRRDDVPPPPPPFESF